MPPSGARSRNKDKRDTGVLDGEVAIITGATSGIGVEIEEVFVSEGAKAVLARRRKVGPRGRF